MLKCVGLKKKFGERTIFSDFTFEFPTKGIVAILGESGSGKSTLLNMINGLDQNYEGSITFDGNEICKLNYKEQCEFRLKKVGYVFQNFNLVQLDTAFNNVLLPLDTISNASNLVKKKRVEDCLKLVGLSDLKKSQVNKLSGGEKQRVAIARSLVNNPDVILCDEPTGALDEKNGEQIFDLLKQISSTTLVIIASHDVESIERIANIILKIENEEISIKNTGIPIDFNKPLLIGTNKNKRSPRLSFSFKIRHAFQRMKSKKYRSLITNIMLSLSLTGVGISMLIKNSVSTKVTDAFKAILNGNQIVMSLKNENEQSFSQVFSASFSHIEKAYQKYNYLCEGIGVNYLVNYEDFFKDKNQFHIESNNKSILIDGLSARNINDFVWLNEEPLIYPMQVDVIDDDQIVLGLSYADMTNLCFQLQIQRNYTSLGRYIYQKGLNAVASFENDDWEYDDEQIFEVVGVVETSKTCIYHSNELWNESVFEEMMRLPSDDDTEHKFPWEMYKIYFIKTKEDPSILLDSLMYDREFDDFVFERANTGFNPLLCSSDNVCLEKRLYAYSVDKNFISPSSLNLYKEKGNFYYTSEFGYSSYASNLLSGFSKNVFMSLDDSLIDQAIDADTALKTDDNLTIDLPSEVVQGNYLISLGEGVRFSSKMDNLIYGRKPSNLNEIVISEGLAKKLYKNALCLGKRMVFAGEINEIYDSKGNIEKEYRKTNMVVVGITKESKNYVYHNSDWTITFFRDKLGVSNFLLIPRSVVFEFGSEKEAKSALMELSKINKEYKVTNPLDELQDSIGSTLEYANTILIAFSILSSIISILLLWTVMMLNILESSEEIKLFNFLGINKSDIKSTFVVQGVSQGIIAFLVSTFELIFVDILISVVLSNYMHLDFVFSLNYQAIIVIFCLSLFIPYIVCKIMLLFMLKKET